MDICLPCVIRMNKVRFDLIKSSSRGLKGSGKEIWRVRVVLLMDRWVLEEEERRSCSVYARSKVETELSAIGQ